MWFSCASLSVCCSHHTNRLKYTCCRFGRFAFVRCYLVMAAAAAVCSVSAVSRMCRVFLLHLAPFSLPSPSSRSFVFFCHSNLSTELPGLTLGSQNLFRYRFLIPVKSITTSGEKPLVPAQVTTFGVCSVCQTRKHIEDDCVCSFFEFQSTQPVLILSGVRFNRGVKHHFSCVCVFWFCIHLLPSRMLICRFR